MNSLNDMNKKLSVKRTKDGSLNGDKGTSLGHRHKKSSSGLDMELNLVDQCSLQDGISK